MDPKMVLWGPEMRFRVCQLAFAPSEVSLHPKMRPYLLEGGLGAYRGNTAPKTEALGPKQKGLGPKQEILDSKTQGGSP